MPSIFLQRQKDDFFRDITSLGSVWIFIVLMIFSLIFESYMLFAELALGLAVIYLAIIILRSLFFKERPKKYEYKTLIDRLDAASFPSNHSARTSFLAILFMDYFNNAVISAFLILFAVIVLYSRIYLKKHDFKDVLGGVVLGVLVYYGLAIVL